MEPSRSVVVQRQADALRLEVLRAYFDFSNGRPTAESVAEKLNIPVRTVRDWLADGRNAELLDEIVPLWPNITSARQFASEHVEAALNTMVDLMLNARGEKVRLEAATTLLGLAGVRPTEGAAPAAKAQEQEEQVRPAVLLNLFVGGGAEPVRVVDGTFHETAEPIRLVGEILQHATTSG